MLQPEFTLFPAFTDTMGKHHRAIKCRFDFGYIEDERRIVIDVKGVLTPVFRLKAKIFLYKFRDIELRVVK